MSITVVQVGTTVLYMIVTRLVESDNAPYTNNYGCQAQTDAAEQGVVECQQYSCKGRRPSAITGVGDRLNTCIIDSS